MDKEQQKKLITEIVEINQKNGLYEDHIGDTNKMITAVDWLIERIESTSHDLHNLMKVRGEFEQAKEMEKKQIMDAFNYSIYMKYGSESQINTGEQYYNDTYNK